MRKPQKHVLLSLMALALLMLMCSQLSAVQLAHADPGSATYTTRPTNHATSGITVTSPGNAYDSGAGWETSYASFLCDADGYFDVITFSTLTDPWRVVKVDLAIKYESIRVAGKNDEYRIVQYVDPSATEYVLRDWTTADTGVPAFTANWYGRPEPNDGAWSWTDVSNIRVRFDVNREGGADGYEVRVYDVRATVTYRNPALYVDPSSQTVAGAFTVDINITNMEYLYSWEFNVTYDTTILTATDVTEGSFLQSGGTTVFTKWINDTSGYDATKGWVYVTCALQGDVPGVSGSGDLATIDFSPDATTLLTTLDLHDTKLVEYEFLTKTTYNFPPNHRAENDGTVTITAVAPEFLLGGALEIALAAVVIYVWWRSKHKPKPRTSNFPK